MQAALAIGSTVVSSAMQASQARQQQRMADQVTRLNLAQQQAAVADRRAMAARDFRMRMAEQMALAGRRGGSSSLVGQFAAQSLQNYGADITSLNNQSRIAEIQAQNELMTSSNKYRATRASGFADILNTGINTFSMSAFGGSGATDKVR